MNPEPGIKMIRPISRIQFNFWVLAPDFFLQDSVKKSEI